MADDTAEAGENERGAGLVAREHVVGPSLVGRLSVGHRSNDRQLVGALGQVRDGFAKDFSSVRAYSPQFAPVFQRTVRLRIKGFLVGDTTRQKDVNHAFGLGLDEIVLLDLSPGLSEHQQFGERKPQSPEGPRSQKPATTQLISMTTRHSRTLPK